MPQDTIFLSIPDITLEDSGNKSQVSLPDESISIVLAADATYFYPMACVIKSACENKKDSTVYQFVLLVDDDFTEDRRRYINKILKSYHLPEAKLFNRAQEYLDVEYKVDHLSRASCYRLQIPTLLAGTAKCIYLDCDTLVRGDLSEFYDLLDDDDLIVGVLAAAYQLNPINAKAKAELLGLPDIDTYTNSGVMVMNLALMRQIGIEQVFDEMLEKDFPDIDQDILNASCYGRVKIAPPKFNAMTKYKFSDDAFESDPSISKCWTFEEWEEARTNPVIVHFADTDKPWTDFALPFSREWWGYIEDLGIKTDVFNFFYDLHARHQYNVYEMRTKLVTTERELSQTRDSLTKELFETNQQLSRATDACQRLKERIQTKNKRIKTQKERILTLKDRLAQQRKKTIAAQNKLKEAKSKIASMKESKSYKIGRAMTKPYRAIKGKHDVE